MGPQSAVVMAEKEVLTSGGLLTANHISAANILLKKQFPLQNGLKDTHYLATKHQWDSSPQDFVQIIFITPGHWACLSNNLVPETVLICMIQCTPFHVRRALSLNKLVVS